MFGVYCLKNEDGNIKYIGKGKVNEEGGCNRWKDHSITARRVAAKAGKDKKAYRVHHWMAKHDGWSFEWIVTGLDESIAFSKEAELIKEHRKCVGRELLNSSEGGRGLSSESAKKLANRKDIKEKKSQAQKGVWRQEEHREKMKAALKECNGRDYRREQAKEKANKEWQSEQRREAARKRAQELWADPVWSAQRRRELKKRNQEKAKSAGGPDE